MRVILKFIVVFLLVVFELPLNAQSLKKNEVVVISGEKFIVHQIETGETIFSLTQKFKVSREELEKYNPKLTEGPKIGDVIKIPFREDADVSAKSGQERGKPSGFLTHRVKSKNETAYFIARQYGISVEELYAHNPGVTTIKKGLKLQIPFWNEKTPEAEAPKVPVAEKKEEVKIQPQPLPAGTLTHQVVSGETLYSIAKKYGVGETEILALNPAARNLKAGAVLSIPVKKKETAVVPVKKPKEEFSGKYFEHIIESGETLWGTARKYDVTEGELKALNPILNTDFPAGAVIRVPVKETEIEQTEARPLNEEAFDKHDVTKGETLYGVSKEFHVSIYELKKYNPVLEHRNLVEGETILIPHKTEEAAVTQSGTESVSETVVSSEAALPDEKYFAVDATMEIPEFCKPQLREFSSETFDVALFLPLFLEANDTLNREEAIPDSMIYLADVNTHSPNNQHLLEAMANQDTTIEVERKPMFKKFYRSSENFVQFYEGVLMALDHLEQAGQNVRLHVFDTEQRMDAVRKFIFTDEFLQTDLIIGPIYPEVQKEVAQIAAKNRIPLVSPLAAQSGLLSSNPYYYQVNPTRDYLTQQTADMVAEEYHNSNFIILKTQEYAGTPEGKMVDMLQEKFFNSGFMSERDGVNFTIYDFQREGAFGLRRIMSSTKENVIYIPSSDEGVLSISISNLNNLASDYSMTLIGTHRYPSYQSIQIDHFHNLKLKYLAPYWIDYNSPKTIRFVSGFKTAFGTEPDNFGFQGYDVTTYFVKALAELGRDFGECLPFFHVDLIQGNYHFDKYSQFGGYMNQGVSVISYTRNYDVKRERVKGQPRLVAEIPE
ncbi:LysM peptidoglycan-binding domain-containing protein [Maribellus sp. CM-23]|uniref:LysM peptidoglycan-binding domain-containing protein n=1 Tax=Maribellus sp. CM-23 TaxID=2781026 RepID=UPI001F1C81EC|nr:LysM peptidoglycan-binding domain-containing protein [Maribellus sp. CM-23]MCE4562738.1 LysM peptidoglycan-binding domain-containing protein [Maribellus sp. CM-23]